MTDRPTHPRPQLVREGWTDLCGAWGFAVDDADRGRDEGWAARADVFERTIAVPYPPESQLSGIHDTGYHPVVWYRRVLPALGDGQGQTQAHARERGQRTLLHFGAVDYRCQVWVDGAFVAEHEGGHTPFSVDVTTSLRPASAEHVVVVRAEDRPTDPTQPRGKQDWQVDPHKIWYHRTTGIWQPVWLEQVPDVHVAELQWTPDVPRASVGVEVTLNRIPEHPLTVRVRLRLGEELLAETSALVVGDHLVHEVAVPAARNGQDLARLSWSPESPTLVDAEVAVLDGGRVVDEVSSYLGLRSTGWADGRFLLNGRPYFLRLVLEQGYWPQSLLAAPDDDALRREVELVKELGFNGVRIHQKVEDPRFLAWCDRLGVLVWGEMANAYAFSTTAVERLTREWLDVVRRDRSHPCVVTWVPMNESWGVHHIETVPAQQHYASALYHLTKALDPSRPVLSNEGWEHTDSDIWGVHDYGASGAGLRERYGDAAAVARSLREGRPGRRRVLLDESAHRGQPVVLTEFGGLSFTPARGDLWFGYSTVSSADDLLERLEELVGALLDSTEVAGFCYTQLTDTEQEPNGLLTGDRVPKADLARIRAIMERPARAVPTEEVDAYRIAAAAAAGESWPEVEAGEAGGPPTG